MNNVARIATKRMACQMVFVAMKIMMLGIGRLCAPLSINGTTNANQRKGALESRSNVVVKDGPEKRSVVESTRTSVAF